MRTASSTAFHTAFLQLHTRLPRSPCSAPLPLTLPPPRPTQAPPPLPPPPHPPQAQRCLSRSSPRGDVWRVFVCTGCMLAPCTSRSVYGPWSLGTGPCMAPGLWHPAPAPPDRRWCQARPNTKLISEAAGHAVQLSRQSNQPPCSGRSGLRYFTGGRLQGWQRHQYQRDFPLAGTSGSCRQELGT
jgi:hypothetical protein